MVISAGQYKFIIISTDTYIFIIPFDRCLMPTILFPVATCMCYLLMSVRVSPWAGANEKGTDSGSS